LPICMYLPFAASDCGLRIGREGDAEAA
jgi:hypothetical protein